MSALFPIPTGGNPSGGDLVNSLSPDDHHATATRSYPRPGRIPGSVNVFVATLLDPADGTFKPVPQLRELFADVQTRPGRMVSR
ncbi:hypothetical protein [Solwaraspora sp. WMMA2101]|uniref:hypothetical protein n=1 Tax=Solwaraspora sp. WMMA2101 TaxID=3404124 RepID=UPI003B94E474